MPLLDKVDLSQSMSQDEFDSRIPELENELARLQREIRARGIPLIIVFEGWDAIGMGYIINRIIHPLDKRGLDYHFMDEPCEEERVRPFLWRFAMRTPARGRIAIFDKSWYSRAMQERVRIKKDSDIDAGLLNQITRFERQLHDNGTSVIKMFLHVSWKEKMRLLKTLDEDLIESWGFSKKRLEDHKLHKRSLRLMEKMLIATDCDYAPWTVVESEDRNFAVFKIMSIIKAEMQRTLATGRPLDTVSIPDDMEMLATKRDRLDLNKKVGKEHYERKLVEYQARLRELQARMFMERKPLVAVFEGWDAAGKGGNISRLTRSLNPRTYKVVPVQAPTVLEKNHHYLMRFMGDIPARGHMTIFDRSWYGRVLVERVEQLASEEEWRRAYHEINEFEQMLVNEGWYVIKFWLEIDREEQLRRFQKREGNPDKSWKITDEDWRNRDKWDAYSLAVDEMLLRTSTSYAPWTIVEANHKPYARLVVLRSVIGKIENILD
jgi:polyphosphate:AMP phosphotransferase